MASEDNESQREIEGNDGDSVQEHSAKKKEQVSQQNDQGSSGYQYSHIVLFN